MFWIALLVTGGLAWNGLERVSNTAIGSSIFSFFGVCIVIDFMGLVWVTNSHFLLGHLHFMVEAQLPLLALFLACTITAIISNFIREKGRDLTGGEATFLSIAIPPVTFGLTMMNSAIFLTIFELDYGGGSLNGSLEAWQVNLASEQLGTSKQSVADGNFTDAYWGIVYGNTALAMSLVAICIGVILTALFNRFRY